MVSDAPNSSWHPAMMPNSTRDLPQPLLEHQPPRPAEQDNTLKDAIQPAAGGDCVDAWIPTADDGEDWMMSTNSAPLTGTPPGEIAAQPDATTPPVEHTAHDESSTASKHFSSMSFTRTVPHEVSWSEEDDAEWTLSRADTDPFKFMPENNRTNSFPPVAPLKEEPTEESSELEQPIPFSEAEQLVREIELEESRGDEALPDATSRAQESSQPAADVSVSDSNVTGDSVSAADRMPQARYEEGMPLVASAKHDDAHPGPAAAETDLFAEDAAGEEDDFFTNVRQGEAAPQDDFQPPPVERKSTMDVLSSLDATPAGVGLPPLEEAAEDSELEEQEPQRVEGTDVPVGGDQGSAPVEQKAEEGQNGENLDEKWKAMFADEDDQEFLPDEGTEQKEVDATAFLGSDDEGLLEDSDNEQPEPGKPPATLGYTASPGSGAPAANAHYRSPGRTPTAAALPANPYLPTPSPVTPANPYLPTGPAPAVQPPAAVHYGPPPTAAPTPAQFGYTAPPALQEKSKAQSFVDKSKGGYTSPYDLPMEVVKVPKRRTSAQPLQSSASAAAVPPPPRSASMQAHPPPPGSAPTPGTSRPGSSHSSQGAPSGRKPGHESFFEELPVTTKPRPASRQSQKSQPSPTQPSPYGLPPQSAPPSMTAHSMPPPGPPAPTKTDTGIPDLVAPPRVNPYAPLASAPGLPPAMPAAAASTRYSPAPPGAASVNGRVPSPASSRYSPAPPVSRQPSSGYGPAPTTPGPPILPHQPRTSSPLAHFEVSHERSRAHAPVNPIEGGLSERRSSSSLHESRLQRVPSLPPTREVEEEEGPVQSQVSPGRMLPTQPASPPVSRYAPPSQGARQTPPLPPAVSSQTVVSPPKRVMSNHGPLAPPYDFAPPPRSQTQSPGALYGSRGARPADPIPRPSSVNDPTSPRDTTYQAAVVPPAPVSAAPSAAHGRPRGSSLNLNVIPPTDGREHDPLQRWRGAPLVSWGVGGTFITMFPKEVPRYGMNQSLPSVVRSPGDVKIRNVKDITPLEERLAKFPGPLKGKSKKKETIAWLTTGIETLERGLPTGFYPHSQLSHEDKRAIERVLLWKVLRVFIEHDGVLEGNPAVEKAVREILTPGSGGSGGAAPFVNGTIARGLGDSAVTGMQSDGVSPSTVEEIRLHLLEGDSEKAVWAAVDQRLWGHALLLSNALAPNLYRQVAQEFVRKEVNFPGHNNESLGALYSVLSGNHEESVDELVPVHARAGLQLVAKDAASGPARDGTEGLDKWRETLTLILSNRSTDDARAINSLGALLSSYGRAEAAHICFMFARSHAVFGGLDDPLSQFVLVGSDHKKQAEQFAKEIEPLLLSEVYEYGQSLAGVSSIPVTNPHLAAYKLQHALALAEYGFRDKALQYCDAIAAAITAQTKRSPYHHPVLENSVEDLMRRLKQAPKEESSSWIPKPSMNKVSDTVWSKFNKFVSGEDESSGQGSSGEGESGPFARVAGGTPTISRSPSASNLETFGAAAPSYGMPAAVPNGPVAASAPPTRAASRYAPGAAQSTGSGSRPSTSAYAPRSSGELNRGSFELPRRSLEQSNSYSPARSASPAAVYTPQGAEFNAPQQSPYSPASQPSAPGAATSAPLKSSSYQGGAVNGVIHEQGTEERDQAPEMSGYQPPSYGYEPPSLTPYEPPAEEKKDGPVENSNGGSYEPPSYQPYGYEPPSYEPGTQSSDDNADSAEESKPKPKKKGIMYDDEDDFPVSKPAEKPAEKTKEEKDRENAEMFRKAAEEDAKRAAEAAKQAKKGWAFTSWFGGGAKKEAAAQESAPNKPIRAKLGEPNSFYYDPELKRWVNKNAGPEEATKKATPPPPRAAPRSVSASPGAAPPPAGPPGAGRASAPPTGPPRSASLGPPASASDPSLPASAVTASGRPGSSSSGPPPTPAPAGPVSMLRSASNTSTASAPPLGAGGSRPPTSLSNSSSIDDLLGAAGPRKPGAAKKPKRGARYVDVMGKS